MLVPGVAPANVHVIVGAATLEVIVDAKEIHWLPQSVESEAIKLIGSRLSIHILVADLVTLHPALLTQTILGVKQPTPVKL